MDQHHPDVGFEQPPLVVASVPLKQQTLQHYSKFPANSEHNNLVHSVFYFKKLRPYTVLDNDSWFMMHSTEPRYALPAGRYIYWKYTFKLLL